MIMIIGSQHDDILYFESIMSNKRVETVLDKYKVTIGTIFNQSVILVDQVKTNYISSILTLHLIEKYFVFLVFVVGRCIAFTHDIKPADIAISKYVMAGDVDQVNEEENVKMCQIPGFDTVHPGNHSCHLTAVYACSVCAAWPPKRKESSSLYAAHFVHD